MILGRIFPQKQYPGVSHLMNSWGNIVVSVRLSNFPTSVVALKQRHRQNDKDGLKLLL